MSWRDWQMPGPRVQMTRSKYAGLLTGGLLGSYGLVALVVWSGPLPNHDRSWDVPWFPGQAAPQQSAPALPGPGPTPGGETATPAVERVSAVSPTARPTGAPGALTGPQGAAPTGAPDVVNAAPSRPVHAGPGPLPGTGTTTTATSAPGTTITTTSTATVPAGETTTTATITVPPITVPPVVTVPPVDAPPVVVPPVVDTDDDGKKDKKPKKDDDPVECVLKPNGKEKCK